MDQQVELDRRMLDWIVGLDTEMNELVEGSHLYHPKVRFSSSFGSRKRKYTCFQSNLQLKARNFFEK